MASSSLAQRSMIPVDAQVGNDVVEPAGFAEADAGERIGDDRFGRGVDRKHAIADGLDGIVVALGDGRAALRVPAAVAAVDRHDRRDLSARLAPGDFAAAVRADRVVKEQPAATGALKGFHSAMVSVVSCSSSVVREVAGSQDAIVAPETGSAELGNIPWNLSVCPRLPTQRDWLFCGVRAILGRSDCRGQIDSAQRANPWLLGLAAAVLVYSGFHFIGCGCRSRRRSMVSLEIHPGRRNRWRYPWRGPRHCAARAN